MNIIDRRKFTRRVKLPLAVLIMVASTVLGLTVDIIYCGYPVTAFVSAGVFFLSIPILDSIDFGKDI